MKDLIILFLRLMASVYMIAGAFVLIDVSMSIEKATLWAVYGCFLWLVANTLEES